MADAEALRIELDEWRDLLTSGGWTRLLATFEAQWGDASVVRALERLTDSAPTLPVSEEARRLLQIRVALRQFLAVPQARVSELERLRAQGDVVKAKPWTRPA